MRALFVVVRVVGAGLITAAIVTQYVQNVGYWQAQGIDDLSTLPLNFFSFFTIDSNILTVISFAVGAVLLVRGVADGPRYAVFRASVTAYMAVTGIVYNTLLRSSASVMPKA